MKRVSKLSLLLVTFALASCNEKVTPELEGGNSTTPPDPTVVVPPTEYYFQVTNKTAAAANFNLHKTGPNKRSVPCKVKSSSQPLHPDTFGVTGVSDALDNDITCFLEAEELALYHHGASFEVSSSPNTCEYIGYQPYSFFHRMPGDSSGAFTKISCLNDTTGASHVATAAAALGIDISTSGADLGCGDWGSRDILPGARVKFQPLSDADLCRYNYKTDNKEQCDIGTIVVNDLSVTYTPPGADPAVNPSILKYEVNRREIQCGGKIMNCVKGAAELLPSEYPRTTWITESVINTTFAKTYTLPSLYTNGSGGFTSNRRYANYRRDLASYYVDIGFAAYVNNAFNNILIGDTLAKTYTPGLIDLYTSNLKVNGDPIISTAALEAVSYPGNTQKSVPLAAEPFLGIDHSGTDVTGLNHMNRANPFYTFYCFDGAFDIKARIRMVIREWDRLYPNDGNQEFLSDIFLGTDARQDNKYLQPVAGGDLSEWIPYNDFNDWDDRIPMTRTDGGFSINTEWAPKAGWFNPNTFPSKNY